MGGPGSNEVLRTCVRQYVEERRLSNVRKTFEQVYVVSQRAS